MKIDRRGKAAGQQQSDLRVCGGQGRGRTADLPIFSWTFEEVDTDLLALLTADCCPRATYLVTIVKSRA
jgi:hypothetical protein